MRLLKSIWLAGLIGALSLLACGAGAQAKQTPTPPAKKAPAPEKAPAAKPQATSQAPPKTSAAAPAKTQTKAPAKAQPQAKAPAKAPAAKAPQTPAETTPGPAEAASADLQPGNRRDPFASLVGAGTSNKAQEPICRAPGKGGIVIETMVVDGIARSATKVIAVVRTPQQRVYMLYEGDRLCDGRVVRITLDGLTLTQSSRDAFGKVIERTVSKRLFPSAGE